MNEVSQKNVVPKKTKGVISDLSIFSTATEITLGFNLCDCGILEYGVEAGDEGINTEDNLQ